MLPLTPAWLISALAALGGVLCALAFFKMRYMPFSFRIGLILIAPALIGFGVLYFYFTSYVVDVSIRQASVRLALLYLFFVILLWQIILHKRGGK